MKRYFRFDKNLNLKSSEIPRSKKPSQKNNLELAKYSNIGYYLITPLLIGVFLGLYFHSVLVGVVIGTVETFYNLFRLLK